MIKRASDEYTKVEGILYRGYGMIKRVSEEYTKVEGIQYRGYGMIKRVSAYPLPRIRPPYE